MELPLRWKHHHKNGRESGVGDSDKVLQMILSSVACLIVFPMVTCNEWFGQQGQENLVIM